MKTMNESTMFKRIFARDTTLWASDAAVQETVKHRLGWLDSIDFCLANKDVIDTFSEQVKRDGFKQVILLGMGGSALAPEVFSHLFPEQENGLKLQVLDSTCAQQIKAFEQSVDVSETLFLVSSKSGSTIETWSLFHYFYQCIEAVKGKKAGDHFAAITDGGSDLQQLADQYDFRHCFINPADIGGRFSALSFFGLVPAALLGIPLDVLLSRAQQAKQSCLRGDGAGVLLGEWLANGYVEQSLDKLLLTVPEKLEPLIWWVEQLVAESLGKQEQGILPVLNKKQEKKQFAYTKQLNIGFSMEPADFAQSHTASWNLLDKYDVAAHFFHWEFATAIAGAHLGINPFDEPNVTEAKQQTKVLLEQYAHTQLPLPAEKPLADLWAHAGDDSYVAILAYWPINADNYDALQQCKKAIEDTMGLPVTVNFGPRYLHSTGQLHKGGKRQGLFIVLTQLESDELDIPGGDYSFNTLCQAQALGDYQILTEKGLPAAFYTVKDLSQWSLSNGLVGDRQ
ncbi:MAG: hypothetical protein ACRBHB_01580 [Arenicella sp.]